MANDRDALINNAGLAIRQAVESLDNGNAIDALFRLEEAADHLREVVRQPNRPTSRWNSGETSEEPSAVAVISGARFAWL